VRTLLAGLLATLLLAAPAAAAEDPRTLHGRCVALRSADGLVARDGTGWTAAARAGEPLRLQATALGRYLLLARDGSFLGAAGGRAGVLAAPSADGDWRLEAAPGGRFTLRLEESGQRLGVAAGRLSTTRSGTAFALEPATRCAAFPEVETNVAGEPYANPLRFAETKGLIETHLHGMAFEFLGGSVHCGRPWHPLGPSAALVDCPDHGPNGQAAAAENLLAYGNPAQGHNTDGWPTFAGWPTFRTYTHEQTYWKWLERAWRGGLRLYTNLLVDNEVLCEVYPLKRNSCNEMDGVRLQRKRIDEMIAYIDAQSGGPGKGFVQIVRDPFEARRTINEGKLALVLGIEVSKLFDCGEVNGRPTCDRATIDRQLDEVHRLGVRQMELVNKNDNGLVGVAGDAGTTGILTNNGNKYDTGHYWAMETCRDGADTHDHDQPQITTAPGIQRDELAGGILSLFLPLGTTPLYPPAPHCNAAGLTDLGAHLIRRMIEKDMIFDPDHMSVRGRDQALSIIEAAKHGGVMSSHTWSTPDAYKRILALGGVVTPATKSTKPFIEEWKFLRANRNERFLFGTGWSTDMNGFASQGGPPAANEPKVTYPFRSLDGSTTLDRQKSGTRTFDLNTDGTAHFGLYPDRLEHVRLMGGEQIAKDLVNGAEAYLQMWERAEGVPGPACRAAQRRFTPDGLGEIRLGQSADEVLRSAGQPQSRPARVWTWCAGGTRGGEVRALLTTEGRVELVASTAPLHRFRGIGKGSRAPRRGRVAPGLRVLPAGARRAVFGVRRGRVTFTAIVPRRTAASPARLRAALRAAGLPR
jgi:hypothetical protein